MIKILRRFRRRNERIRKHGIFEYWNNKAVRKKKTRKKFD
jgi:hypothetical protein